MTRRKNRLCEGSSHRDWPQMRPEEAGSSRQDDVVLRDRACNSRQVAGRVVALYNTHWFRCRRGPKQHSAMGDAIR